MFATSSDGLQRTSASSSSRTACRRVHCCSFRGLSSSLTRVQILEYEGCERAGCADAAAGRVFSTRAEGGSAGREAECPKNHVRLVALLGARPDKPSPSAIALLLPEGELLFVGLEKRDELFSNISNFLWIAREEALAEVFCLWLCVVDATQEPRKSLLPGFDENRSAILSKHVSVIETAASTILLSSEGERLGCLPCVTHAAVVAKLSGAQRLLHRVSDFISHLSVKVALDSGRCVHNDTGRNFPPSRCMKCTLSCTHPFRELQQVWCLSGAPALTSM